MNFLRIKKIIDKNSYDDNLILVVIYHSIYTEADASVEFRISMHFFYRKQLLTRNDSVLCHHRYIKILEAGNL